MEMVFWIALNLALAIVMVLIVPLERIRQLFVYGLIGGTGIAVVVFAVSHAFNAWEAVGGLNYLSGYFVLLPTIAWFFPVVIFGHFFPRTDSLVAIAAYVLLWAAGSVLAQWIFLLLGMWQNRHWSSFSTFLLAIVTHSVLAYYIMKTEQYIPER